eukprot:TRINITY_DN10541_c0_g2_i2.p1 TRINITY_DN10541_c0_g2~~TRINITY_DN10541_c0_g2_i2.p1  ORF type:complete len:320 (+),score=47.56 TRINITY_DN10541_c0_g2_i2:22-960(+)
MYTLGTHLRLRSLARLYILALCSFLVCIGVYNYRSGLQEKERRAAVVALSALRSRLRLSSIPREAAGIAVNRNSVDDAAPVAEARGPLQADLVRTKPFVLEQADKKQSYRVELIHESVPRCWYLHSFLSDREARRIVEMAQSRIARSGVVAGDGKSTTSDIRTSMGMFLQDRELAEDPVTLAVRSRIGTVVNVSTANMEHVQVLRYQPGQQYVPHPDYFPRNYGREMARGGQRFATCLMWLNDVAEGGETEFPYAKPKALSLKPKRLDGICWRNTFVDSNMEDSGAIHAGRPPRGSAEKWVAVVWIREREFH